MTLFSHPAQVQVKLKVMAHVQICLRNMFFNWVRLINVFKGELFEKSSACLQQSQGKNRHRICINAHGDMILCVKICHCADKLKDIKQAKMLCTKMNAVIHLIPHHSGLVRSMMGSLSLNNNLQSISFLDDIRGDPDRKDSSEEIGGL